MIIWNLNKFKCIEKIFGYFSIFVKLESIKECSFLLTPVYGTNSHLEE